jgi:nucleotide-binding universal stress UspA family protein
LALALQFRARLVLAHIVPTNTAIAYTFPTESLAAEKEQYAHAKSTLPTLIPPEFSDRIDLQTIVKGGNVADELLAIVNDDKIDLVVMGTHGRNALERFLLGSMTERMLRKVGVPILTVSHLDPAIILPNNEPVPLRKILYATNLSDSAGIGLKLSLELARGVGARLTVVHVLNTLETAHWSAEGFYLADDLEMVRKRTFERLEFSVPEHWCEGVDVTTMMVEGEPFREILRITDEEKADLIVINLQDKTLLERAFLGSTAERVIRSAHVPVLSIPVTAEYGALLAKPKGTAA